MHAQRLSIDGPRDAAWQGAELPLLSLSGMAFSTFLGRATPYQLLHQVSSGGRFARNSKYMCRRRQSVASRTNSVRCYRLNALT